MIENRIEEAPSYDATAAFDSKTRTVPSEIGGTEAAPGAAVSGAQPLVDPNLWTPEEVAEQWAGVLSLAQVSLGDHWDVGTAGTARLGVAWCPIFQRYVPKSGDATPWLATAMVWLGVLGATKEVLGPPIKKQIQLAKEKELQKRREALSRVNTRMGTSVEASPYSESEAPENRRSWSAS